MSTPTHEVTVDRRVPVPMRDGTVLRADVYRPAAPGRYPVIVERVAYELDARVAPYAEFYASRGYVFVGQNTRGTFWSEGADTVGRDDGWGERKDGYDTIEWAGVQPWSNGRVGTVDGSYSGFTQYLLVPTRPPHLATMFVRMGPSEGYQDMAFPGGIGVPATPFWWVRQLLSRYTHESAAAGSEAIVARLQKAVGDPEAVMNHLPSGECPVVDGITDSFAESMRHPEDGAYWWPLNARRMLHEVDTPIMHLGGWFDDFLSSTLTCFSGIRENGRSEETRRDQRLLVGPWIHGPLAPDDRQAGELDFGPATSLGINEYRLRWFEHWLGGVDNGVMDTAPVRLFLMRANRWVDFDEWPPPGVQYRSMFLREGSGARESSLNNGGLSLDKPSEGEQPDTYEYDPANPVPALTLSLRHGPTDHRSVEGRMLTYTSEALQRDLTVIGPVKLVLHAGSSAPDTDWIARLCDVWPDGRSMSLCRGGLRARYRNSFEKPELMKPGQAYQFEVDLAATAQVFRAGHRLRVQVASTEFPVRERNMNTGGVNSEEAVGRVARNTVFHDPARPSHLVLPVMR